MIVLGIDIGGTGIKGAPVDTEQGKMLDERFRVLTPHPATPEAIADGVAEIVQHFNWTDRIGCGFPAVIKEGKIYTAANIDHSWIGTDAKGIFERRTRCKTTLMNDADAAGLAEVRFGAGRGKRGVVLMITLGTGIGSGLFVDGTLVPNTELGHIEMRGHDAETRASDKVRIDEELSWRRYSKRLDRYLNALERILWPDLMIIGGGGSKYSAKFLPRLSVTCPVVPAQLLNEAGIIGAALAVEVGLAQPQI